MPCIRPARDASLATLDEPRLAATITFSATVFFVAEPPGGRCGSPVGSEEVFRRHLPLRARHRQPARPRSCPGRTSVSGRAGIPACGWV